MFPGSLYDNEIRTTATKIKLQSSNIMFLRETKLCHKQDINEFNLFILNYIINLIIKNM